MNPISAMPKNHRIKPIAREMNPRSAGMNAVKNPRKNPQMKSVNITAKMIMIPTNPEPMIVPIPGSFTLF